MNVTQVLVGKSYRIIKIDGGLDSREILAQRGLFVGAKIGVLHKNKNSVLLKINDTVFLLTQEYQKMIEVV